MHRMDFGLFYFASSEGGTDAADRFRLIRESALFADRHDFSSLWMPERHFHAFGGLSPNPAVLAAGLATITERIELRAGSVVVPLHDPIRVVEEWSLVDNLSRGRVGLGLASGWFPDDFVLARDAYEQRRELLYERMDTIRRLWRGEAVSARNGVGDVVAVKAFPRPVQRELDVWVTAAANPETFREAGKRGANVLTHLLFQSVEQLVSRIGIYREARAAAGHAGRGVVTVMVHTFVGASQDEVYALVREPMKQYLGSSVSLANRYLFSVPGFQAPASTIADLTAADVDRALEYSFERYYRTSGLFGTPASCLETVQRLHEAGADELGCLIDFGVETDRVLASLQALDELRRLHQRTKAAIAETTGIPTAVPASVTVAGGPDAPASQRALEATLAEIWSDLLERDCVDVGTNLFDLGAHSVLVVRALERIRQRTGLQLAVTDMFRFPSIRTLARHLGGQHEDHRIAASSMRAAGRKTARRPRRN